MNEFLNIVWDWRFIIIAFASICVYALVDPQDFKARILKAIVKAKSLSKDGILKTGVEQEDWVVTHLINYLNGRWAVYVAMIGEDKLRKIIKELYDDSLDLIDDGIINGTDGKADTNATQPITVTTPVVSEPVVTPTIPTPVADSPVTTPTENTTTPTIDSTVTNTSAIDTSGVNIDSRTK